MSRGFACEIGQHKHEGEVIECMHGVNREFIGGGYNELVISYYYTTI